MKGVLQFLSNLYWLSLPETVAETLWHSDWKGAYRRSGVIGLLHEAGRGLLGTNSWPFFIGMDSRWAGAEVERLLDQYGIQMWGQGFHGDEFYFRVRRDKAGWAQHVMSQAGVPLQHGLIAERSAKPSTAGRPSQRPGSSRARGASGFAADVERRLVHAMDAIGSALDL